MKAFSLLISALFFFPGTALAQTGLFQKEYTLSAAEAALRAPAPAPPSACRRCRLTLFWMSLRRGIREKCATFNSLITSPRMVRHWTNVFLRLRSGVIRDWLRTCGPGKARWTGGLNPFLQSVQS